MDGPAINDGSNWELSYVTERASAVSRSNGIRSESNATHNKVVSTIKDFFFVRFGKNRAGSGKGARTDLLEVAEAVVHGEHRCERIRGLPFVLQSGRSSAC